MKYVLTAKAGDCTVYAEDVKTAGLKSQVTNIKANAIHFDDRDVARSPTLVRFWSAVTGLSFEFVPA